MVLAATKNWPAKSIELELFNKKQACVEWDWIGKS